MAGACSSPARAARGGAPRRTAPGGCRMPSSSTLSSASLTASSANLSCLWTAVAVMRRAASRHSSRARWPPRKASGSSKHGVVLRRQQRREGVLGLQRGELARRIERHHLDQLPGQRLPGGVGVARDRVVRAAVGHPGAPRAAAPRATAPSCRARPSWPAVPPSTSRPARWRSCCGGTPRPIRWSRSRGGPRDRLRRMRSDSSKARWKRGVSTSTFESLSK